MTTMHDETAALRTAITHALAIADEQRSHLVAALLAECLDRLDRTLG
ncbi:hypothetical protein [Sphingomonas sp. R86520]